jgi:uncharacterized protein YndB with AHSA1/START domain
MNSLTEVAVAETTIAMSRVYDAPRELVWQAMTQAKHIRRWWGGPGFSNPVCEMDVRPGGLWHHVMRFPDGHELRLEFVFLEVEPPCRLTWRHVDHGSRKDGPPTCRTTVTLDDLGGRTRWRMVAEFNSPSEREAAIAIGFSRPIEISNDSLVEYLKTMPGGGLS